MSSSQKSQPSKTPYHQGVQNYHAWDVVTHKTVPVMVFAGMYNPRRSQFKHLL
jgi:hypothetical protein